MAFLKNTQAWEIFFAHIGSSYSFKRSKYRDQCYLIVRSRESEPPRSSAGTPFSVLPRPSGPRYNGCHHFMTCLCPLLPCRLRAPPKQGLHPISVFLSRPLPGSPGKPLSDLRAPNLKGLGLGMCVCASKRLHRPSCFVDRSAHRCPRASRSLWHLADSGGMCYTDFSGFLPSNA